MSAPQLVRPADVDQHALRLRRVLGHLRDGTTGSTADLAAVLPWYTPTARPFAGTVIALLWADTLRVGHGLPAWAPLLWASRRGGVLRPGARGVPVPAPVAGGGTWPAHVYCVTAFDWPAGLSLSQPRGTRASWATQVAALRDHAPALFTHAAALADYCVPLPDHPEVAPHVRD